VLLTLADVLVLLTLADVLVLLLTLADISGASACASEGLKESETNDLRRQLSLQ
jgi:hypothetical protein